MKTTAATIFASLLMVLATIAGCGSGRRTNPTDGGTPRMDTGILFVDSGPMGRDTGPVPHDAGTDAFTPPRDSGHDTGGRMCATSCSTDSQCASTCPAMPSRASCCDMETNTCFTATTSVCPMGGDDAGTTMSY
jgi:hypothetical protein